MNKEKLKEDILDILDVFTWIAGCDENDKATIAGKDRAADEIVKLLLKLKEITEHGTHN